MRVCLKPHYIQRRPENSNFSNLAGAKKHSDDSLAAAVSGIDVSAYLLFFCWPLFRLCPLFLALMLIRFGLDSSCFGRVRVSTPLSNSAVAFSVSTEVGSGIMRLKLL